MASSQLAAEHATMLAQKAMKDEAHAAEMRRLEQARALAVKAHGLAMEVKEREHRDALYQEKMRWHQAKIEEQEREIQAIKVAKAWQAYKRACVPTSALRMPLSWAWRRALDGPTWSDSLWLMRQT